MRTLVISLVLASATPLVSAQATLQLLVKQSASPNTPRPFRDLGRFDIRLGNTSSSEGECPGNTDTNGRVSCRFVCSPQDQSARNFKIVPPRNERTRGFTAPTTREVSLQGCQLSVAELEFVYVDFAVALRELTRGTPLETQFASAGTPGWNTKFDAASKEWEQLGATPAGRQKLDQLRALTGEIALEKASDKETAPAALWDNFSVGISNVLLKNSALRLYGQNTAAQIKVSPSKADFYRNLRVLGTHIEAKESMTPLDARVLTDVNKLSSTSSDKLPTASFKSIALD
ncbi:MAG: hypothetical protein PSV26_15970 [Polaromonas sp.]|uniref:hypothetical protein n=1 Tax=Polaromonas sp. TaxID=1869339 RepID=UPI0024886A96|nr:hypothetical protein [Polaromonas sp.]MDI1238979.1 hypothetical protein [Polaromonas sp.]